MASSGFRVRSAAFVILGILSVETIAVCADAQKTTQSVANTASRPIPTIVVKDGRYALMVDGLRI